MQTRPQHVVKKVLFWIWIAWCVAIPSVVGAPAESTDASRPTLVAKERRMECRRDTVTEWYDNGAAGVEQGFTLTTRPAS